MRTQRRSNHSAGSKAPAPIKTTLMDLMRELTRMTDDDRQVLAVVKNIFASHKVRLSRSLAPVRLVNSKSSGRMGLGKKSAAWA
jgi:hypothetical protein